MKSLLVLLLTVYLIFCYSYMLRILHKLIAGKLSYYFWTYRRVTDFQILSGYFLAPIYAPLLWTYITATDLHGFIEKEM